MKNYLDLSGKTALVTGASGGLGRTFSLALADAGASVVVVGRDTGKLDALAQEIEQVGRRALVQAIDVKDPASVAAGLAALDQTGAMVDILVNNAGITSVTPALEQSGEDWDAVLRTNLNGAWLMATGLARRMRERRLGGSIINIASILGLRVAPQLTAYNASKAALIHLTRALALEWAPHGIRVNAIAPGYIATEMNQAFFQGPAGKAMIRRIPQARIGQPADLAAPLLLLASDASSYMTGSVMAVDGGHLVSSL